MKIIGHRGAAGHELENTLASIQKAIDLGVDAIEFDIRKTKDNQLVLCHDADLQRISDDKRKLSDLTLKQLQKVPLLTGSHIPTLAEALEVLGKHPCIIEIKETETSKLLAAVLKDFPHARVSIVSHKLDELVAFRSIGDKTIPLFGSELTKPFDIIHLAKRLRLDGVSLNYWLLNPLTYWLCKRAKLSIMVWTVNHSFQIWFLSKLYPDISIVTDYPEYYLHKRH